MGAAWEFPATSRRHAQAFLSVRYGLDTLRGAGTALLIEVEKGLLVGEGALSDSKDSETS